MPSFSQETVTRLLVAVREGDHNALNALFPRVYEELRHLAQQQRRGWHGDYTLNTTALVHEAYLKLVDQSRIPWQDRVHFFAVAARAMRFILIDYARQQDAQKRGGDRIKVSIDDVNLKADAQTADLLALNEALTRLAERDERMAQVVECRFFGGLTIEETAAALEVGSRTVKRDWQKARLLLYQDMRHDA